MKQKVKELRVQIDGLATLTKGLEPLDNCIILDDRIGINKNSIQINKAIDSLFLAKAWLGKVLGELGEDSPYSKDGTRKTVEDIEPTADTGERIASAQIFWKKANHIEKVDWLRQEISKIVGEADILMSQKGRVYIFGCNINKHLSEARFHLGFELERVREEDEN